ncbi:MAG: HDOD domain-containing protein [Candidatus Krumholzibacteriia bacterium]
MIGTDEIFAKVLTLPTLPVSVARLAALMDDPRAGALDFEAVIRPDPALTANLLRLANSAYFGLSREVDSVRQAVALMGLKRVFEMAASVSFARVIPPFLPGYGIAATGFWTHCIAVGTLSERLARELGRDIPGLLFTAGLLHDVGKLAIGSFLMEETLPMRARLAEARITFVAAERAVLGTDHAEVGQAAAQRWALPPAIGVAARWHHAPLDAPTPESRVVAGLVHAADGLAHLLGFGTDVGEMRREVDRRVVEMFDLRPARLEKVAGETFAEISEMARLFAAPQENRP